MSAFDNSALDAGSDTFVVDAHTGGGLGVTLWRSRGAVFAAYGGGVAR